MRPLAALVRGSGRRSSTRVCAAAAGAAVAAALWLASPAEALQCYQGVYYGSCHDISGGEGYTCLAEMTMNGARFQTSSTRGYRRGPFGRGQAPQLRPWVPPEKREAEDSTQAPADTAGERRALSHLRRTGGFRGRGRGMFRFMGGWSQRMDLEPPPSALVTCPAETTHCIDVERVYSAGTNHVANRDSVLACGPPYTAAPADYATADADGAVVPWSAVKDIVAPESEDGDAPESQPPTAFRYLKAIVDAIGAPEHCAAPGTPYARASPATAAACIHEPEADGCSSYLDVDLPCIATTNVTVLSCEEGSERTVPPSWGPEPPVFEYCKGGAARVSVSCTCETALLHDLSKSPTPLAGHPVDPDLLAGNEVENAKAGWCGSGGHPFQNYCKPGQWADNKPVPDQFAPGPTSFLLFACNDEDGCNTMNAAPAAGRGLGGSVVALAAALALAVAAPSLAAPAQ